MGVQLDNIGSDRQSDSNSGSAFMQIQERMQTLSFRPFQNLVVLWLAAGQNWHMLSLGRSHRRGRRRTGGADFIARAPGSRLRIAVQIRHWRTPIQRRAVDELWGFMLRHSIPSGLIVTNTSVSRRAVDALNEHPGRPIQVISSADLARSMVDLGLGTAGSGEAQTIDESFFRTVHAMRFASQSTSHATRQPRGARALTEARASSGDPGDPDDPYAQVWPYLAGMVILCALLVALIGAWR